MMREGRCVLPPDEAGRILDRPAGLQKVIAPALVRQVLSATKRCNLRACRWTHVVRGLMFEAARREHLDPDRLSFTGCFQILQCRLPECDARTPQSFRQWCDSLLWELGQERIEPRRNRINPRVIERKMSHRLKNRPQHRQPPPLTKTFAESIVMIN